MKLYNTLSKTTEEIQPQNPPEVTIYTCGPTVYDYAHIGHWFTYVRWDLVIRVLKASGLQPKWVMNITDVGHLVSDADEGEDKLEKGAKREGKTAWEVAEFYERNFLDGMESLNILRPDYLTKATEHIPEQIELIKTLETKGYAYTIDDGVYFDTSKFKGYAAFARLDLDDLQAGARVEYNQQKRTPSDFALWKFSPSDHKRDMEWWAPWQRQDETSDKMHVVGVTRDMHSSAMQGADEQRTEPYVTYGEGAAEAATQQSAESTVSVASSAGQQDGAVRGSWGFPGWHIECSAMAMKYLGETIDIHAGGIDHIPVHHTNEIAQSEAATGKRFANYWLHANHLMVNGEKISKSLGNGIRLSQITEKGISLEAFRLHVLESHYRSQSKFSWESLEAAQNRLKAYQAMADQQWQLQESGAVSEAELHAAKQAILDNLQNDLDTPNALAVLSQLETAISNGGINTNCQAGYAEFLLWLDETLGLKLHNRADISDDQKEAVQERTTARQNQDWAKSDELRDALLKQGISLRDTPNGAIWTSL